MHGTIGEPGGKALDGTLTVSRVDDAFAPTHWPVSDSHWKALVYLIPGPNKLRFDFSSPKLSNSGTSNPIHACHITINMLPPNNSPPLQLAIFLGKDSPGTFDAIPARVEREGNNLETAVRKFRMAAYLWQAYTAEQMHRNKLGRRVFRFDEEWVQGTACYRDREFGTMRSEARVHVIRTDKTVQELRSLHLAQQNGSAGNRDGLYDIGLRALRSYFDPKPGQKIYVSAMFLDSHWDKESNTIVAHAALGGSAGDIALGIFGSHCLQSYPTSFEEVAPAFSDCTPTDTNYVGNDCNEAGSSWEAANIGIGAHLHETGHLLGLPHRASGVMLRDYVRLNRSFLAREAYSTRTKEKGGLVLENDECTWHRLDCLHFRSHPCFRLPNDPPVHPDDSVQAWTVEGGSVMVTAPTGISYVELYSNGEETCHTWIEFYPYNEQPHGGVPPNGHGAWAGSEISGVTGNRIQRQVLLTELELRARMPAEKREGKLRVVVKTFGGGAHAIDDFGMMCNNKDAVIKLGSGKTAFRSSSLGMSPDGSEAVEAVFTSAVKQGRVMSRVHVWSGGALDGVEFIYDDDSRQLVGKIGGKPGGDVFELGKWLRLLRAFFNIFADQSKMCVVVSISAASMSVLVLGSMAFRFSQAWVVARRCTVTRTAALRKSSVLFHTPPKHIRFSH